MLHTERREHRRRDVQVHSESRALGEDGTAKCVPMDSSLAERCSRLKL